MPSHRFYIILTGLFFIMAIVSLILASYTYRLDHPPFTAGSNPSNSDLGDAISAFDSMTNSLDLQIAQLQSLYSNGSSSPTQVQHQSQVYEAPPVASTLTQRAVQLDAERIQLQQEMIGPVQPGRLDGLFFYGTAISSYYYIADGVYANVGSEIVHGASVTFTFYYQPSLQGSVLCTVSYSLGDVVVHGMVTLGHIVCGRNPGSMIGSVGFKFKWTTYT